MDILFFLLVILTIAALAPFLGKDSRDLRDQHSEFPWDRLPH